MLNKKNLAELNLNEEQLKKYKEFEAKEKIYRAALQRCNVHHTAIDKIISMSDLNKVPSDNIQELEENIKETWEDFIF